MDNGNKDIELSFITETNSNVHDERLEDGWVGMTQWSASQINTLISIPQPISYAIHQYSQLDVVIRQGVTLGTIPRGRLKGPGDGVGKTPPCKEKPRYVAHHLALGDESSAQSILHQPESSMGFQRSFHASWSSVKFVPRQRGIEEPL